MESQSVDGHIDVSCALDDFSPAGCTATIEAIGKNNKRRRSPDGAGLSAVLARLGSQRFETAVAVAQRPIEQCIDGNRRPFRMGDVVGAAGDLLGPAREFAAGKSFDYQLSD